MAFDYNPDYVPSGPNTPRNEWYKKINHVKIEKGHESKASLDADQYVPTPLPSYVGDPIVPPSGQIPDWWHDYTEGALTSLHAFTRASTATYVGSDGTIKTAAVDEPRFEYELVDGEYVPAGLLIEPAGENKLLHSSDFGDAAWTFFGPATGEKTGHDDPSGGKGAARMEATGQYGQFVQNFTSVGTGKYAYSIWLRSGSAENLTMHIMWGGTDFRWKSVTVTPYWQRHVVIADDALDKQAFSVQNREVDQDGTEVYMWAAQVELGTTATSYIPTTGTTKTRAADICTADISSVQATETGPELVTNGGFDTDASGWTMSGFAWANNRLELPVWGGNSIRQSTLIMEAGKTYLIEFNANGTGFVVQDSGASQSVFTFDEAGQKLSGVHTFSGDTAFEIRAASDITPAYVDNISVKEVTEGLAVQGTVFAEVQPRDKPYSRALDIGTGIASNGLIMNRGATLGDDFFARNVGDSNSIYFTGSGVSGEIHKMALAGETDVATLTQTATNGSLTSSRVGEYALSSGDILGIGGSVLGTDQLNGHIRRIQIWGKALDDTDLQAITAGGGASGGPTPPVQITRVYALTVGQQNQRVGLTSGAGSIDPSSIGNGWTITRMQARVTTDNVRFRVDGYNGSYTGQVRLSYDTGSFLLDYDGGEEWEATDPDFSQYLQANVGNTVSIRLERP